MTDIAKPDLKAIPRRYLALALWSGIPLLALIVGLGALEYRRQFDAAIQARASFAEERRIDMQSVIAAAQAHVAAMRTSVVSDLEANWRDIPRPDYFEIGIGDRVLMLNRRPAPERGERHGVILGVPNEVGSRPSSRLEQLAAIDRLFLLQSAIHAANPHLRWSYFLSTERDLAAFYPWQSDDVLLAGADKTAEFKKLFDSPSFAMARPERNESRAASWSEVFIDPYVHGLRVQYSAPVDAGGQFRGTVGTELALGVFEEILAAPPRPSGIFILVDQYGLVVAEPARRIGAGPILVNASEIIGDAANPAAVAPFVFTALKDRQVLSMPLDGIPWRLVHVVPSVDIHRAAAASVAPYMLILAALFATLLLAYWLLRRQFIELVARITGYIEQETAAAAVEPPLLSALWQPWVDRIGQAFLRQRQTIARLRQAEAFTAAVVGVALDAIVTADRDGRIIDFNPAAERIFGHPASAARGRPVGELIVPPELRAAHEAGLRRFVDSGDSTLFGRRMETEALHADGHIIPVELEIHQVQHAGRTILAAFIRDLTEAKAREREIDAHKSRLHQAEKMTAMGSLLAGVAHELNNPLAVVIAQTTLLTETSESPAQRSRAEKIYVAADRCGRIVKTFLAMARQEAPRRARISLNDAVDHALEVTAYGLRTSGIELEVSLDPDLPAVLGDTDQLAQVVSNLVINAQHALAECAGPRKLAVRTNARGETVSLEVADNGPGIPSAVRDRIFEAFFTTKPVGAGTGIGLAVCRNIVNVHGGTLTVSDNAGGGALFRMDLPVAVALSDADADCPQPAQADQRHLSVLVVDDEPDVSAVLVDMLRFMGHAARATASTDEAVELVRTGGIDLVMSDLRMPGGGGIGLRRSIGQIDAALADRFIFVTGDTVAGPATIRATGWPAVILEKPFVRVDLARALGEVFGPDGHGSTVGI